MEINSIRAELRIADLPCFISSGIKRMGHVAHISRANIPPFLQNWRACLPVILAKSGFEIVARLCRFGANWGPSGLQCNQPNREKPGSAEGPTEISSGTTG
jgi:hypothetical protein